MAAFNLGRFRMEKNRMISRSIILDPVNDRIQHIRYEQHKRSLEKISRSPSGLPLEAVSTVDYSTQIQRFKKSSSQVRTYFNSRSLENRNLVKKMLEIDGRKNPFGQEEKRLPSIYSQKQANEKKSLQKENQKMVERILEKRAGRTKEEIIKEFKVYQKYKTNLRKIKGKQTSTHQLKLVR